MSQTPEPTDDADPRSLWSSPISLAALKAALYEAGGGVAPDELDPAYLNEITDAAAEEAWRYIRDAREGMRAEIAGLLHLVSEGRKEYLSGFSKNEHEQNPVLIRMRETLEMEVALLEMAARIAEGDDSPLYGLLPSWRWTDAMTAALYPKPEEGSSRG